MMHWYGGGMGPLVWIAMSVFWLVLLGVIGWLIVRLLPGGGTATTIASGEPALDILDRRLASGEIELAAWQAQRAELMATQHDRTRPAATPRPIRGTRRDIS